MQKRLKRNKQPKLQDQIPASPVVPVEAPQSKSWIRGDRIAAWGIAIGILIAALTILVTVATPEVRRWVGLDHPDKPSAPPVSPPLAPKTPPDDPKLEKPKTEGPHLQYVPLPKGDPFRKPRTFVTSIPRAGEQAGTVSIDGATIPVMTQYDAEKVLVDNGSFAYTRNIGKITVFLEIGEDGRVQKVKALNGDAADKEAAAEAAKEWKFKPFMKNGKSVAVQTAIQLDGSKTKEPPKEP